MVCIVTVCGKPCTKCWKSPISLQSLVALIYVKWNKLLEKIGIVKRVDSNLSTKGLKEFYFETLLVKHVSVGGRSQGAQGNEWITEKVYEKSW